MCDRLPALTLQENISQMRMFIRDTQERMYVRRYVCVSVYEKESV